MNNNDVINIIQPFVDAITNKTVRSACIYAFKSKHTRNSSNSYVSLDYNFYEIQIQRQKVENAFKNILSFFESTVLANSSTEFQEYSINNPKKVIDYIPLNDLDFSQDEILYGTQAGLNSDNYKIQYFLNSLNTKSEVAENKRDYIYFKHSVIKLTTNSNNSIYIVNKVSPIYKPKGFLFTFNTDDNSSANDDFKPVTNQLFKLPFYPHIIIVNNYCFLIEPNVESIFGFEKYNKQVCNNSVTKISNELNFSSGSFDFVNSYSNKGRNFNLFSTFNNNRYEKIKNKDSSTMDLLKNKMEIDLDTDGNIMITNERQAEKLILYLCNCIFKDIEDDVTFYESKNSRIINP